MNDDVRRLLEMLAEDGRYHIEAYLFVQQGLCYTQGLMDEDGDAPTESAAAGEPQRHVTGQELCEGLREYAIDQFGPLARQVLEHWGIRTTGDFGEIVYNLIRIETMRQSPGDRREDFDDVFDFAEAFDGVLTFELPEEFRNRASRP